MTQQQWMQNQSAPTVAGEKLTAPADAQQEVTSLTCGTAKKAQAGGALFKMTAGIDRMTFYCCDCGRKFTISAGIASDLTRPTIRCPHCGKRGTLVKECRR